MKQIAIVIQLLLLQTALFGQQIEYNDEFQSKWVFGGNFGVGFSSYGANIAISPQIGYRVTSAWDVGARLTYNYSSYSQGFVKFSSNNFGGGFFTSYEIFRGLFAQLENEYLSFESVYVNNIGVLDKSDRTTIHSIFIGGGYRQYFSSRGFASFTVLYNLNDTYYSPYSNPLFRVGFGVGF